MAYDASLIQTLYGMLNGTNAPRTKRQFIGDLNAFILDNIPYAQIERKDLQLGHVVFDGRQTDGADHEQKPMLVWHFGGLPYPIIKAASVEYNYVRTWDGSGLTVHASIVMGFQEKKPDQTLHTQPRAHFGPQQAKFVSHIKAQGSFIDQLTETVAGISNTVPSSVVSGSPGFHDLDSLINAQFDTHTAMTRAAVAAADPTADPQPLPRGLTAFATAGAPFNVEFEGPAKDADSHNIFAYTLDMLMMDQKLVDQILWWYFAGSAMRITKAMRIPLGSDPNSPSLFVGYSGPGIHP
jgi:hypothetical protein